MNSITDFELTLKQALKIRRSFGTLKRVKRLQKSMKQSWRGPLQARFSWRGARFKLSHVNQVLFKPLQAASDVSSSLQVASSRCKPSRCRTSRTSLLGPYSDLPNWPVCPALVSSIWPFLFVLFERWCRSAGWAGGNDLLSSTSGRLRLSSSSPN